MPGGIHFLFGLLLFYIFQWVAFLVDATRRRKRSLSSSIASSNTTTNTTVQQMAKSSSTNPNSLPSISKIADSSITSTVENPSKVNTSKTLSSSIEVDPRCETSIKSSSTHLSESCCCEKTAASTSTYVSKPAFSIGGEDGLTPILHRIYYRKSDREWFQYGLLVGSILPDIDLCVVILTIILSFLFLGWGPDQHKEVAETLHRGATHSLVFFLPLLIYFVYLYNEKDRKLVAKMKMQAEQMKVQEEEEEDEDESLPTDSEFSAAAPQKNISRKSSEEKTSLSFWEKLQHDYEWLNIPFAIGLLVGFIFHTLLDVIYMKGVKMFWPIYTEEIFVEVPWLYLLDNFKYPPMVQKLIMTIDHSSEVLFYLAIIFYRSCTKRNMEKQLKSKPEIKEAKPIDQNSKQTKEIEEPHNTFTNIWKHLKSLSLKNLVLELWNASEDDWDLVFRYACVVQLVVIWLAFFLMYFFFPDIDFVQFVIYIYFPGTVFVLLSLLAPFCFKTTLSSWDFSNVFSSTPRHPRPIISLHSTSNHHHNHHIKTY